MSAPADQYAPTSPQCGGVFQDDPDVGTFCSGCGSESLTAKHGDAHLDSDAPDNGGWDKERHCATDLRGANWAGIKLREAQEQIRLCKAMFQAEADDLLKRLDAAGARMDAAARPFLQTQEYMENALRVFAETHRDEVLKGLRKKSRLLPCGVTIGWKKHAAGYRYDQRPGPDCGKPPTPAQNRDRLLEWCRLEEDVTGEFLVKSNPAPDLDAIKAHLAAQVAAGENIGCPPGLEYIEAGETLTVSVGEEESK